MPVVWKSLGQAVHHHSHLTLALRHDRRYRVPDFPSTSWIELGHARSPSYPTDSQVDAWDGNAGQADYQLENKAAVMLLLEQLRGALALLREWTAAGELFARAVNDVCVHGNARLTSIGWRHTGKAYECFMLRHGIADARTLQKWLGLGWEFAGLLLATPEIRQAAIMRRAVNFDALEYLRERGAV